MESILDVLLTIYIIFWLLDLYAIIKNRPDLEVLSALICFVLIICIILTHFAMKEYIEAFILLVVSPLWWVMYRKAEKRYLESTDEM